VAALCVLARNLPLAVHLTHQQLGLHASVGDMRFGVSLLYQYLTGFARVSQTRLKGGSVSASDVEELTRALAACEQASEALERSLG
jgi:hypothetical protein